MTPDVWTPRLLRIQGDRKLVQVTQVPLQKKNVTSDDIFVLDLGTELLQRNGSGANIQEKMRAMQFVSELKGKRSHEAMESSVHDDGDDDEVKVCNCGGSNENKDNSCATTKTY